MFTPDYWMNRSGMGFKRYAGDYYKQHYDVIVGDTVYPQIWPNAGRLRCNNLILADETTKSTWDEVLLRPSPIHPCTVLMERQMTHAAYCKAMADIDAYVEWRKPYEQQEMEAAEREQEALRNQRRYHTNPLVPTRYISQHGEYGKSKRNQVEREMKRRRNKNKAARKARRKSRKK